MIQAYLLLKKLDFFSRRVIRDFASIKLYLGF